MARFVLTDARLLIGVARVDGLSSLGAFFGQEHSSLERSERIEPEKRCPRQAEKYSARALLVVVLRRRQLRDCLTPRHRLWKISNF